VACVANQIGVYANNGQSAISQAKLQAVNPARLFAYDGTHMLGEYGATGIAVQETIWLGNLPVATLQNGAVYNIYPDQIGTPRVITNASNTEVWKWDSDPFGTTPANEDPTGSGSKFTYNLRFPGQYFLIESGLHYNWYRHYDPIIGRYLQADALEFSDGPNLYSYALSNPTIQTDATGEDVTICYYPSTTGHVGFSVAGEAHLWRHRSTPHSCHGYPGQTYCAGGALAELLR
jgi:RHS repeat-associated protein